MSAAGRYSPLLPGGARGRAVTSSRPCIPPSSTHARAPMTWRVPTCAPSQGPPQPRLNRSRRRSEPSRSHNISIGERGVVAGSVPERSVHVGQVVLYGSEPRTRRSVFDIVRPRAGDRRRPRRAVLDDVVAHLAEGLAEGQGEIGPEALLLQRAAEARDKPGDHYPVMSVADRIAATPYRGAAQFVGTGAVLLCVIQQNRDGFARDSRGDDVRGFG